MKIFTNTCRQCGHVFTSGGCRPRKFCGAACKDLFRDLAAMQPIIDQSEKGSAADGNHHQNQNL